MNDFIKIIDIGTSKISVIIGGLKGTKPEIKFINSYPSSGIKKGKVVDMEALSSAIKRAVKDIESTESIKIKRVSVCNSGVDIKGLYSSGAVKIRKKEIRQEDVNLAIESASAVVIPQDREIFHIMPVEFIVDENSGIKDPIGMKGARLEAKVYVITASANQTHNIITCCNNAGIEVEDVILQSIASSEAVLSYYDKELGSIVLDIGAGTTDGAVFFDGDIKHIFNYGIAGNHISNDLAIGLKISQNEAERIKKHFGIAIPDIHFVSADLKFNEFSEKQLSTKRQDSSSEIEVVGLDKGIIKVPMSVVKEVVNARCEEIIEKVKEELSFLQEEISISSVVITGGTALMQGFATLAESLLSLPVRIGRPDMGLASLYSELGVDDSLIYEDEIMVKSLTPEFSSLIGAFIYKIRTNIYEKVNARESFFEKIKGIFRNLIKS